MNKDLGMEKEYKCEHCGKEMSKQDYYELNGLCIDCWEDKYKQEEDLYRYKNEESWKK